MTSFTFFVLTLVFAGIAWLGWNVSVRDADLLVLAFALLALLAALFFGVAAFKAMSA